MHINRVGPVGSTQPREMKFAAKTIHSSSTPGLPITRTKPAGFGLTGCRRPEEKIYTFSKMPENYVHGVPQYYATAMPTRGSAIPLVAKWNDGRPTKLEGNAQHPDSNGGTDLFAQASILNLYDADRAQRFTKGSNTVSSAQALDFLASLSRQFSANGGEGLCFLMERSSSPSRVRLQNLVSAKFPRARWFLYEPIDLSVDHAAINARTLATKVFREPTAAGYASVKEFVASDLLVPHLAPALAVRLGELATEAR